MGTKAPPSPWYSSRTLWVGVGAILSNLIALLGAAGVIQLPEAATAQLLAVWNSLLGVLAIVFRWQASGPLGSSGSSRGGPFGPLVLVALCLGLVSGTGCAALGGAVGAPASVASQTPAQHLWASYGAPLKVAAAVYEDTMREAGALHARGQISDEQLEQVRKAGKAASAALRLARSALAAFLEHRTASPPSLELFTAQTTIANLLEIAAAAGVTR